VKENVYFETQQKRNKHEICVNKQGSWAKKIFNETVVIEKNTTHTFYCTDDA